MVPCDVIDNNGGSLIHHGQSALAGLGEDPPYLTGGLTVMLLIGLSAHRPLPPSELQAA